MAFISCGCRIFCCNIKAYSISSGDEGNRDGEKMLLGNSLEALEVIEIPGMIFGVANFRGFNGQVLQGLPEIKASGPLLVLSFPSFSPSGQQQEKPRLQTFVVAEDVFYVFSTILPGLTFWPSFSLPLNVTVLLTIAVKMAVSLASPVCCCLKFLCIMTLFVPLISAGDAHLLALYQWINFISSAEGGGETKFLPPLLISNKKTAVFLSS